MGSEPQRGAILITGASTGIGRATALHLDQRGFQVFATVRKERDASTLEAAASERLTPVLMDVTDEASILSAREVIYRTAVDAGLVGLVNNADELRWLFNVNVFGLLTVTQAFLPLLRQAHGRIVNVSSTASLVNAPFNGPYTATKLSVNGLSNSLRLELRPFSVTVSVIICGIIKTPIWEKGRAIATRAGQHFPPQALELYGDAFRQLGDFFARVGEQGRRPEAAARAITHALTAKRARQTYFVGHDARIYNIANKLLFGRLRDWVILRTTGVYRSS
jgi:NAD(P)-dependent dehydrogenase (short-subunit alcohol dehydrogenase family)